MRGKNIEQFRDKASEKVAKSSNPWYDKGKEKEGDFAQTQEFGGKRDVLPQGRGSCFNRRILHALRRHFLVTVPTSQAQFFS